jgi:hypothetical protein
MDILLSCETKVLAPGCDRREDLLPERLVAFVFGKVEFYFSLVVTVAG